MDEHKVFLELPDRRMELPQGISTVGRSHRCEIVLADRSASRRHALISLTGSHITVQDLGSSNGTLVNGERIHGETVVDDGDLLLIGETEIFVRSPALDAAQTVMMPAVPPGDASARPSESRSPATQPLEGGPSRTEAVAVGDVIPVGEVLATPSPSWDQTGVIGRVRPEPTPASVPTVSMPELSAAPGPADPPVDQKEGARETAETGEVLPSLEELEERLADLPPPASATAPGVASASAPTTGKGDSGVQRFTYRPGASRNFLPPAGFFVRAGALMLDVVWMALFAAAATLIARSAGFPDLAEPIGAALGLALAVLVPIAGWSRWGTTPGKAILGLYVCDVDGGVGLSLPRAVLRWVGYGLSAALFGLGFLMAGLNANRRALHDLLARSYVGHRARR